MSGSAALLSQHPETPVITATSSRNLKPVSVGDWPAARWVITNGTTGNRNLPPLGGRVVRTAIPNLVVETGLAVELLVGAGHRGVVAPS